MTHRDNNFIVVLFKNISKINIIRITDMKTAILLVASILLSAINATPFSQPRTFEDEIPGDVNVRDENYRLLPQKIRILRYAVTLTPYFSGINAFTFDGEVTIMAEVDEDNVLELKLHAKMLNFKSVMHGLEELEINLIDDKYDFWIIKFKTPPAKGRFEINIKYTGVLGDDMHGFYRSSYEEKESSESKKMITKCVHFFDITKSLCECNLMLSIDIPDGWALHNSNQFTPEGHSHVSTSQDTKPYSKSPSGDRTVFNLPCPIL